MYNSYTSDFVSHQPVLAAQPQELFFFLEPHYPTIRPKSVCTSYYKLLGRSSGQLDRVSCFLSMNLVRLHALFSSQIYL